MKPAWMCCALFAVALLIPPGLSAGDIPNDLTPRQLDMIEKNFVYNLSTCCPDILVSCIQTMIQLKTTYPQHDFDYAVIPLLSRMKNDERCEVRIIAALALSEFDSDLARFAISRRADYDPSERVQKVCGAIVHSWKEKAASSPALNAAL